MHIFIARQEILLKLNHHVSYEEFVYNTDYRKRDMLLGIEDSWEELNNTNPRATRPLRFENVTVDKLETLLLENYIDPFIQCNNQPTHKDIFHFMCKWPVITASGFADNPLSRRPRYSFRIDLLRVAKENVTSELRNEFKNFCQSADELILEEELHCWWD